MRRLALVAAAVFLAGCYGAPAGSAPSSIADGSPFASGIPSAAPSIAPEPTFDLEAAARSACAKATFDDCVDILLGVAESNPGYLVAVCVGDTGYRYTAAVESTAEPEGVCSRIHPGQLVAWLRVPAGPTASPTASPPGGPSITPSITPPPSLPPGPPSPEPTPFVPSCPRRDSPSDGFQAYSIVAVNIGALNVRDEPCLAGHLIVKPGFPNPIESGTLLVTLADVVTYDGYRWYAVGIDRGPYEDVMAGWVAAGTTSDSWLRPATPQCPAPDLSGIAGLSPLKRLACYGSRSLTFTAHQAATTRPAGSGGSCDAQDGQPAWLWCWNDNYVNVDGGLAPGRSWLKLYFDPARGIEPLGLVPVGTTGPAYEIRGHFNDAAASWMCTQAFSASEVAWYGALTRCMTEFVVEGLQRAS